jgi:GTP cyclohydrolase I
MQENTRREKINIEELEIAEPGFANGISLQLNELIKDSNHRSLSETEKGKIIDEAASAYGLFLTALGVDWENDPNSMETPRRVAKAYVNDLWTGRYNLPSDITAFPSDGYPGIVLERDIPVVSQCSHHHQTILGKAHIAYIPGPENKVIGLSKLNRLVEHFSRRGAIQEQLTMAIHNAVDKSIEGNQGVYVILHSYHNCVGCRGVKHMGASMVTAHQTGIFADHIKTAKQEVMSMIQMNMEGYK